MLKLDRLYSTVNGDLQDCIAPVRDRFRQAMSEIIDYAVANPAQGSAATAQTAISTAFKVHYADGLVSPGITIETAITAFNNRHGVGATANAKWVSVRDYIIQRSFVKKRILDYLEEGSIKPVGELVWEYLTGYEEISTPAPDLVYTSVRETTPGITYNFVLEETVSSASAGKRVKKTYQYTLNPTMRRIDCVESDWTVF